MNFWRFAYMFCTITAALGLFCRAERSCCLIFKTTSQLSNLSFWFCELAFWAELNWQFLVDWAHHVTRQICFWLLAGWLSAGAIGAAGPCVFQHSANQCSLKYMVAGQRNEKALKRGSMQGPLQSQLWTGTSLLLSHSVI